MYTRHNLQFFYQLMIHIGNIVAMDERKPTIWTHHSRTQITLLNVFIQIFRFS